jgi:hypothetical protein
MDDRGRHDADDLGAPGEMLHRLMDELKTYARSRPIESLMAAFILGLLVALLGRRDR